MSSYDGPKLVLNDLPFCVNFKPTNGFIKASFVEIIDGDTAYFKINNVIESVRFMVVDTPSIYPNIEKLGIEAKDYTESILKNAKEIYLESDSYNNLRDDTQAHRLLAWIWADGELLNYNLVKYGFATNKYIINNNMKYLDYLKNVK